MSEWIDEAMMAGYSALAFAVDGWKVAGRENYKTLYGSQLRFDFGLLCVFDDFEWREGRKDR